MSDVAGAPMVQFDHVTLAFGGVTALSDVSFHVLPRELFAIIGPNGAGKTSIFNCLSGVYRPTKGEIRFQGERIDRRSPVTIARRGIARTFQNLALFHDLTVLDNVMLGRHHLMRTDYLSAALWLGRAKHEEMTHRARCEDILEIMELESYRFSHVASLPYGVRKRVEVTREQRAVTELEQRFRTVAANCAEPVADAGRQDYCIHRELSRSVRT